MNGETALVTGGSRGLGRGIAGIFAENGYNVAIAYRTNDEVAKQALQQFQGLGVDSEAFEVDVYSAEACRRLMEQAQERFGSIEILVNNAAFYQKKSE